MGNAIKHLLEFGPFRIDAEQRLLFRDQQPIPLSPKAFELLLALVQRSGQVVLKDELMSLLWPDTFVEESNLGQHVFQLRKALGEQAQAPAYIVTVPGRGYRFAQKVRIVPAEGDEEIVAESHALSRVLIEEDLPDGKPVVKAKSRGIVFGALAGTAALLAGAAIWIISNLPTPKVLRVRQLTHSGRVEPYGRVLTDGSRLYFTEKRGGTGSLAQVPVTGGEPAPIFTSLPSLTVYDIDPEKSRLLIGTHGPNFNEPLWVLGTEGGSAQRVGDVLSSEAAAWSPDGSRIFYGHDGEIDSLSDGGADPSKVLTVSGHVISLRLAPNGNILRFTVRDGNSSATSLWESHADGSNPHVVRLGLDTAAFQWGDGETCGDWTPDGKYFVFRSVHGGVESLWAMREEQSWIHRFGNGPFLLYTTADHMGEPRFSPDGKKIFFIMYQERREIVRYDSVQKLFVPYMGGMPARLLSFSGDGQWMAYRNETDGALWRSRVDGTDKLQLTFPPMKAYHSSWSPDGKRIVFGARLPGGAGRLYSVPSAGGKPEVLISSDASDGEPSWSPDGQSIVFERWISNETGTRHSFVYTLDLKTHQASLVPGSKDFDGVHWSPDGRYAAASDEVNHKLMLFDFKRQQWSVLADGAAYGWGIRWSADSRYVYYQHIEDEQQPIFRVRVSDHVVEQITSARQILRSDVLGYSMTGLTPDDSPLASLVQRNSDIYALELELP